MESFEKALAIGGAVSVAVFMTGPGGDEPVWSAGTREAGAADAAAASVLAGAAATLVGLAEPGDGLGDILLTTTTSFHVLRMLGPQGVTTRVAMLTLNRGSANLALARTEFKTITEQAGDVPSSNGSSLPRRTVADRLIEAPDDDADDIVPPGWLAMVGQPYVTDESVLDRIIGSLRHL